MLKKTMPTRHLLSLIVCLSAVFTFSRIALAAEPDTPLINEQFESPTIPENWQAGGRKGSFTIVDGTLRGVAQPDDSHGPSISCPIEAHDVSIEFDVKILKPGGYFLFLLDGDSQFSGQAHLLRFSANGNRIQLSQDRGDPASKRKQKKQRDANGGKRTPPSKQQLADPGFYRVEALAHQTATATDGQWHHVRIDVKGNSVVARLDDGEPFTAEGSVLDVAKSKLVFLVGNSGDVRIDNVKVSGTSK